MKFSFLKSLGNPQFSRPGSRVNHLILSLFLTGLSVDAFAAKTFVYCSEGSPSTFNPQIATDGPTFNASAASVYNTLVQFKSGSTEIEPALAEKWTISKDGLTYTFNLRKGVSFHSSTLFQPTREFNADDVLFSFNRMRQKSHPYHSVSGGNYEYFTGMEMGTLIQDIKKVNDHVIEFKLTKREAPFLANLGMAFASILSAEYADALLKAKKQEKLDTDPIGTGPFVFVSYQKDTMIRYKAFEKYWKGKPAIEQLVFAITTDPSVRFQKLKAGECHLVAEPAPQDIEAMKKNSKLQVLEKEGVNVGYLAFNTEKEPFKKKEVRQAINLALNRSNYIQAIYLGRASRAVNPIPPTLWSYDQSAQATEMDIERAKKLLADAGFPNGFETELWTLPVSRPYNPAGKKMGELMQADLAKIGVKVKLVTYDWPTYLAKSRKGEHQMIQLGWTGDNGDPDNFLNVLLGCPSVKSGSNVARWCHKPFDQVVQQAKAINDQKRRVELYTQAQKIFREEAPWATLAHAKVFRAASVKVKNYQIHPFGIENFEKVDLE